jgi:hypothetical protein
VNGDAWLSVPVIPTLYRPLALPRSATGPKRAFRYKPLQSDCATPAGQDQERVVFTHSSNSDTDIVRAGYRKHENRLV